MDIGVCGNNIWHNLSFNISKNIGNGFFGIANICFNFNNSLTVSMVDRHYPTIDSKICNFLKWEFSSIGKTDAHFFQLINCRTIDLLIAHPNFYFIDSPKNSLRFSAVIDSLVRNTMPLRAAGVKQCT